MNTPAGMTQEQQQATEAAVTQLAAGVHSVEERIGMAQQVLLAVAKQPLA